MVEIYTHVDGRIKVLTPAKRPEYINFKIICPYGDWSGWRTLAECLPQFEQIIKEQPDRYYTIVEDR